MRSYAAVCVGACVAACTAGSAVPLDAGDGQAAPDGGTAAPACTVTDPGRPTLRRLNRAEYNNTVRDLLGDTTRPADDFPADDYGYGFDVIGDVLAMSPLLFEKYELAATNLVKAGLGVPEWQPIEARFEAEVLGSEQGSRDEEAWNLYVNGTIRAMVTFPEDGAYELTARAWGDQAGPEPARMQASLDGRPLISFNVAAAASNPAVYRTTARATKGAHVFAVAFTNDYYMPDDPDPSQRDRNLYVDWLAVRGPLDAPPPRKTFLRERWFTCAEQTPGCARTIVGGFAERAYRRPLEADELDRLLALFDGARAEGETFDDSVGLALTAVLISPHFLFRPELDPSGDAHALSAFELATRLSYFLWSSMPDDALFAAARSGELLRPEILSAQVRRMLADPKSNAFIEDFVGQWLQTRALDDVNPDYAVYPAFDAELRAAMRAETHAFFRALLDEDRSALDLLDADFTYVNDRLARHYGLPLPGTSTAVRVQLPSGSPRGGFLSQASFLTVTSFPKRTSAVKRGKLVMEQLLCQSPPPPPPGVEGLIETVDPNLPLRERMAQHRSNSTCNACHEGMDNIGFGLENFDGIGAWRTMDGRAPIDATGALPPGRAFDGPRALARLLREDPLMPRCFSRKLLTYAIGRGTTAADDCTISRIAAGFAAGGDRYPALIQSLVGSESFRTRRPEAP